MYKRISYLLDTHYNTVLNWANQDRLVIQFFKKYFTKHDIQEFIETKKITWLENRQDPSELFKILAPSAHMANRFAEYLMDVDATLNINVLVSYLGAENEAFMPHRFLQHCALVVPSQQGDVNKEFKKLYDFMMALSKTDINFIHYVLNTTFNVSESLATHYAYPNLELFSIIRSVIFSNGFEKAKSIIETAWNRDCRMESQPHKRLSCFKEAIERYEKG